MTTIDSGDKGYMDPVDMELQKRTQLAKDMQGMAKVQAREAEPRAESKAGASMDVVEISERAKQAAAQRQIAAEDAGATGITVPDTGGRTKAGPAVEAAARLRAQEAAEPAAGNDTEKSSPSGSSVSVESTENE